MTSGVVLLEHQQANPGERTAVVLMLCDKHTNASLPYPKATGFKPAIHQTLTRLWLRLTACGVTACTWCLSSYARPDPTKTLCRRHDPAWRRRQANFPRPEDTSVCLPPAPAVRQTDLTGPPTPTPTPTTRPARLQSTSRGYCLPACLSRLSGPNGGGPRACSLAAAKRSSPAKTMGAGRCSRAQPVSTPVQPALSGPGEARQSLDGFPRPLPKVDDGTWARGASYSLFLRGPGLSWARLTWGPPVCAP